MTITDQITALLSADPICGGRVTGETVRAITEIVSERAAIVAWLRAEIERVRVDNTYWGGPHRAAYPDAVRIADAIERGDFGAGEG